MVLSVLVNRLSITGRGLVADGIAQKDGKVHAISLTLPYDSELHAALQQSLGTSQRIWLKIEAEAA